MEIKPCPFCGSNELGIGRGTEDNEGFPTYIYCVTCGANGPWIYTRDKLMWTSTAFCCEKTGWNNRNIIMKETIFENINTAINKSDDQERLRESYKKMLNFTTSTSINSGGFKKIEDKAWDLHPCRHPDHNPPSHISLPNGTYEYTCPACGNVTIVGVSSPTFNKQ